MSMLLGLLERDVLEAAQALVGCHLVRGELKARIVEAEAYRGFDDPGSHACKGKTPRNAVMFARPGLAYVYFTYGMHWMLNVSALPNGEAGAVLIRAAQPLEGIERMFERRPAARRVEDLLSGPAKLTAAFGIDGRHNGLDLFDVSSDLKLLDRDVEPEIVCGSRIGLQAGKGEDLPWRFCDAKARRWVSRPLPIAMGNVDPL